ncbi:MAG: hypothetical protein J2P21_05285 [Chloracidobacterium sp.]|nr:hypothetical protein [Chloracidobacterium sp.]
MNVDQIQGEITPEDTHSFQDNNDNLLIDFATIVKEVILNKETPSILRERLIRFAFELRDELRDTLGPDRALYVDAVEAEAILLQFVMP